MSQRFCSISYTLSVDCLTRVCHLGEKPLGFCHCLRSRPFNTCNEHRKDNYIQRYFVLTPFQYYYATIRIIDDYPSPGCTGLLNYDVFLNRTVYLPRVQTQSHFTSCSPHILFGLQYRMRYSRSGADMGQDRRIAQVLL